MYGGIWQSVVRGAGDGVWELTEIHIPCIL